MVYLFSDKQFVTYNFTLANLVKDYEGVLSVSQISVS